MAAYSPQADQAGRAQDTGWTGFSVVVPCLNHAPFIVETLDSLLNQGYPNLEILVVDGGSTDGTIEILRRYGDRVRWISEEDHGQSDALAKGFAMTNKEWLTWLNSDDKHEKKVLERVHNVISSNPSADVMVGQGHYIDMEGNYLKPYPTIRVGPDTDVENELFERGYVAQPSVFFKRTAYESVGGVDRTLQFAMDYDLWVRLARNGCNFVGVKKNLSGNRWYETTKTASQALPLLAEVVRVQTREYGRVSPYFTQAISDHLYHVLHSRHHGDQHHILYRTIYFKSVWLWLNAHRPLYCVWGFFTRSIAKSGPIVGDRLTIRDVAGCLLRATQQRFKNIFSKG
ncbi:MAG: glycosyltransferase [Gammaproteobacteria bacterium]|nr:glycosyltransferase [Gammaproteobacteria bacterium]